jgi:uncharacterized iron-regulated membrane protein
MTSFKKVLLFCHRWLGIVSGLVVFIVSITGCIFCFQDEIQDLLHGYRKVEVQNRPYINPSKVLSIVKKDYPKASLDFILYYGKDRPVCVFANLGKDGFEYIYLNPYSGQITHKEKPQTNFFIIVEYLHMYLLLPEQIGRMIVGVSVIIFVVIMITGIVLWWPKRKSDRKRSFTIKWGARWRRVNYDLHNVLGFYATSIVLILAFTGLAISFEWVNTAFYKVANLGEDYPSEKVEVKSDSLQKVAAGNIPVIDAAFDWALAHSPRTEMILIHNDPAKAGALGVLAYAQSMHYNDRDGYEFDKYNGKLLQYLPESKKSAGLKFNEMNYDIHVGHILGFPGKIIAFLASLISASLPITGLIIWLGKRKKSKSKKIREVVHRRSHKQVTMHSPGQ